MARQSLDAAEQPQRGGVCIGISHDGGTRATTLALEAAAANGASTALVTNRPGGSASEPAQRVIVTPVHDDSWCHTVAYTSSILVGALLARELGGEGIDADRAQSILEVALERPPAAAAITGADRIVCAGFGLDFITARELALKLAEGARVPSAALQLESLLHGHLAGEDAGTAVVLIESDPAVDRIERRAAHGRLRGRRDRHPRADAAAARGRPRLRRATAGRRRGAAPADAGPGGPPRRQPGPDPP